MVHDADTSNAYICGDTDRYVCMTRNLLSSLGQTGEIRENISYNKFKNWVFSGPFKKKVISSNLKSVFKESPTWCRWHVFLLK